MLTVMQAQQIKRWTSSLALQVSPCLTLGLLLFASLGARATGLPGELSGCLQLVSSQAQHSAALLSGTDSLERLQLHGAPQTAIQATTPALLAPAGSLTSIHVDHPPTISYFTAAAQPRAP